MHDDEKTKTHLTNWLCQSLPFFQSKFASSLKSSLVLQIRGDPIISKFLNLNFHSSKDCLRKTDFSVNNNQLSAGADSANLLWYLTSIITFKVGLFPELSNFDGCGISTFEAPSELLGFISRVFRYLKLLFLTFFLTGQGFEKRFICFFSWS